MSEGAERRQHARKIVDVPAELALGDAPRRGVRLTEMSLGGGFVETDVVLPFGAELGLFFRLPGHTVDFALRAVVRWTSKTGFGVQFGLCSARETHALSLYLAARPAVALPTSAPRPRPLLGMRALTPTPTRTPAVARPAAAPPPRTVERAATVPAANAPAASAPAANAPAAPPLVAEAAPTPPTAAPEVPPPGAAPTFSPPSPAPAATPASPALQRAAATTAAPPVSPSTPLASSALPAAPVASPAPAAPPSADPPRPTVNERRLFGKVKELQAALAEREVTAARHAAAIAERDELVLRQDDALLECHDLIARLEAELEARTEEVLGRARERDALAAEAARQAAALATSERRVGELSAALAARDAHLAELAARVEALEAQAASPAAARRSAPPAAAGDELRRIRGIGPAFARALAAMGIRRVADVAAWGDAEIAAVAERLKIPAARIRREGWVARATELTREADEAPAGGEPSGGA